MAFRLAGLVMAEAKTNYWFPTTNEPKPVPESVNPLKRGKADSIVIFTGECDWKTL